jgi:hypothetical protein
MIIPYQDVLQQKQLIFEQLGSESSTSNAPFVIPVKTIGH